MDHNVIVETAPLVLLGVPGVNTYAGGLWENGQWKKKRKQDRVLAMCPPIFIVPLEKGNINNLQCMF